jgi:DNA polymerase-1
MLWETKHPELKEKHPNQYRHYLKVERPLIPVVNRMELRGMAVDMPFFERLKEDAEKKLGELGEKLKEYVPEGVNLNSTTQRQELFFDTMGLPRVKKNSTDKYTVKEWKRQGFEVADLLLDHTAYSKLLSSFLEPMPQFVKSGRLYTHFNPCGTRTGRFSSSSPNIQQSTNKFDYRKGFVAPEGRVLVVGDFKQMELVMFCQVSGESEMTAALRAGEDLHKKTVAYVLGKRVDEVTKDERKLGKVQNFGLIYKQSPKGFRQFLKTFDILLTEEENQLYFDAFFKLYKRVKPWHEEVCEFVKRHGYVETITGRRRLLPEAQATGNDFETRGRREAALRQAINSLVQAPCSDLVKLGMIAQDRLWRKSSKWMLAMIHDELVCEVDEDDAETAVREMKEVYENVFPDLVVPMTLEVKIVDNWGEMKD